MKRLICMILLVSVIFCACAAEQEPTEEEVLDWRDFFEVTYKRHEGKEYGDIDDLLNDWANGATDWDSDIYTVKNKTNYVLKRLYLVIDVEGPWGTYRVKNLLCTELKQGETKEKELISGMYEILVKEQHGVTISEDDMYSANVVEILFEIKD